MSRDTHKKLFWWKSTVSTISPPAASDVDYYIIWLKQFATCSADYNYTPWTTSPFILLTQTPEG